MRPDQLYISSAILLMMLLLSACGPATLSEAASVPPIPEITIKATEYAFDAPAQIEAGLVSIILENHGQEPHHVQFVRLNNGVTMQQFQIALQQGPEAAVLVTIAGGPGTVAPGGHQQVTLELIPGHYVLLCFASGHDDVPHLAKGMVAPLEVVPRTSQAHMPEPKADGTVKLLDFSFVLQSEIKAGKQVWQVVNEGQQPHEIALIKLAEGKTMADATAFMQSPHGALPFELVGGFQAIAPGKSGWLDLDLQPGNYVAMCHVPDPASGKTHLEMGMIMPFSVK